jgi:uncharacterized protein (DUF305 family)
MNTIRSISISCMIVATLIPFAARGVTAAESGDASTQMRMQTPSQSTASMHADQPESPSTTAFEERAMKMMEAMNSQPFTGDPDRDFVAHMIPHHQGAVDQAYVELKYGKDPKMKALAQEIIQTQPREIQIMKEWQSEHATQQKQH